LKQEAVSVLRLLECLGEGRCVGLHRNICREHRGRHREHQTRDDTRQSSQLMTHER
jgi:hypothetical protein